MGLRLKETIHQRYRLEHGRENDTARLRYVEKNPQSATGGAKNADAELRMLRHRLDSFTERYSRLLPELEDMLIDMAADWPIAGLSDDQMQWLDNVFVDVVSYSGHQTSRIGIRSFLPYRGITDIATGPRPPDIANAQPSRYGYFGVRRRGTKRLDCSCHFTLASGV